MSRPRPAFRGLGAEGRESGLAAPQPSIVVTSCWAESHMQSRRIRIRKVMA